MGSSVARSELRVGVMKEGTLSSARLLDAIVLPTLSPSHALELDPAMTLIAVICTCGTRHVASSPGGRAISEGES